MIAVASDSGISLLEFEERKDIAKQFNRLPVSLEELVKKPNSHLALLQIQLKEYFEGKRTRFDVALDPIGTDFQKKVWDALLEIGFGKTVSYQFITNLLGNPKAIRAVAAANGANKMALLIPCHRIIGTNGNLTGYAGGLWRKKWLLEHESQQMKMIF